MLKLTARDLYTYNHLLYQLYDPTATTTWRLILLRNLATFITYSSACFYLAAATQPEYFCKPAALHLASLPESFQCTSLLATNHSNLLQSPQPLAQTKLGQTLTQHYPAAQVCHLCLVHNGQRLGLLSLLRQTELPPFTQADFKRLQFLTAHIEQRLTWELQVHQQPVACNAEKYHLTPRQQTIVKAILAGKDDTAICQTLHITRNTLKKHIANIYRNLQISHRSQLFALFSTINLQIT